MVSEGPKGFLIYGCDDQGFNRNRLVLNKNQSCCFIRKAAGFFFGMGGPPANNL